MSRTKVFAVLLLVWLSFTCCVDRACAEIAAATHQFDLKGCIEQALKANPKIEQANLDLKKAEWELKSAQLARTPKIELFNRMGIVEDATEGPEGAAITGDSIDGEFGFFNKLDLEISIPLYTFGRLTRSIEAAGENVQLQEASRVKTQSDLILRVHELYYGLVLARQLLESTKDLQNNFAEARDIADERLEKGETSVTEIDVLKLRVGLAKLSKAVNELERQVRVTKEALRKTIGLDEKSNFEIADNRLRPAEFALEPLEYYLRRAEEDNPDLKRLKAAYDAQEASFLAEKTRFYPTFLAVGGIRYAVAPDRPDLDNPFLNDDFNFTEAGGALALKWDLNFFQIHAELQQKKASYLKTKSILEDGKASIALQVREKYYRVKEMQDNLEWSIESRKSGRGILVLSLTNFRFGIGTGKDVFDGLSVYARTAGDYYSAVFDYNIAVSELQNVVGDIAGAASEN
jgi:outer membrane protein